MSTVVRVKASPAGIVHPVKQRQWRATGRYSGYSGLQWQGMPKQRRQHVSIECEAELSRSFNRGLPRSPGRNRRLAPAAERSQQDAIVELCNAISSGIVSTDEAAEAIKSLATGMQQVEDFAKLDGWRQERTGSPEVVFGAGKTPEQIARALGHLSVNQRVAVATRIEPGQYASVRQLLPGVKYNALGRILTYTDPNGQAPGPRKIPGSVAIVTAGTCDLPVAEECHITCRLLGCYSYKIADVGVAGLHRLLGSLDSIRSASVVIVMAGMDAALPSVLAGLISAPVIAVPTSVGYGASLGGISALLASLNSCAPGVAVVNIDNGFGAAVAASRILLSTEKVNTAAAKQLEALRAQAAAAAAPASLPAPAAALGVRNGDSRDPFMESARPGPGLLHSNGHNSLSSAEERAGAAVGSSSAGAGPWSQNGSLPKDILRRKAVTDLPDLPAGADALLWQLQRIKARRG